MLAVFNYENVFKADSESVIHLKRNYRSKTIQKK